MKNKINNRNMGIMVFTTIVITLFLSSVLVLGAGAEVKLKNLKHSYKQGEKIKLKLEFKNNDKKGNLPIQYADLRFTLPGSPELTICYIFNDGTLGGDCDILSLKKIKTDKNNKKATYKFLIDSSALSLGRYSVIGDVYIGSSQEDTSVFSSPASDFEIKAK